MINFLKKIYIKAESNKHNSFISMNIYILAKTMKDSHYLWPFKYVKNILVSYVVSYKLHGITLLPKVIFDGDVFPVEIIKSKHCCVKTNSKFSFVFRSFLGGKLSARVVVNKDALLKIENTFYIGDGVKLIIQPGAILDIKGSHKSESGITSNSIVFVYKKVFIGRDSIVSWGGYISDSSQHQINGTVKVADISIGDNVWISEGVTISPGTSIGEGSIVGSKAYLNNIYEKNSLIVGVPAKVKKREVTWQR